VNEETEGASHHAPVLLGSAIEGLNLKADGCYMDGTFGRGGHSGAILRELGSDGRLLAIDRDPDAIAAAADSLTDDPRFELINGKFSELKRHAAERDLVGQVDGLLLDLGVSSPQLDEAERGFSFRTDGPLDMRMDPTAGPSAAEWLGTVDEQTLKQVLKEFGEEQFASRIAKAIVREREIEPISRTAQLARIINDATPKRHASRRHPATKSFQAIRIFLNDELGELRTALDDSVDVLRKGGRLCVISFHSLEDRIVKRFMRDASSEPEQYRGLPDMPDDVRPKLRVVGKAMAPTDEEVDANPRARSARLRVAERL
jgi:16S rRNA (cytosine1402-N4)-methyltransferase